jgi:hypothetical protein
MSFCIQIIEEINYAELKLFGTQVEVSLTENL